MAQSIELLTVEQFLSGRFVEGNVAPVVVLTEDDVAVLREGAREGEGAGPAAGIRILGVPGSGQYIGVPYAGEGAPEFRVVAPGSEMCWGPSSPDQPCGICVVGHDGRLTSRNCTGTCSVGRCQPTVRETPDVTVCDCDCIIR